MTESYYQGSNRGSIRSSDLHSSNTSAASSVSARNALLSASSINALVTDRDLFSTAASIVPNLRAVIDNHQTVRPSSVWRPSATGKQLAPGWVVKKKHYGAEISEFDRSKLPAAKSQGPSWLHRTARSNAIRHSMVESRGSLHTRDAFLTEHTNVEEPSRQWPLNDPNVSYAITAQITLSCRLEEAMTMLFSNDELQFDASMSALFGTRKYRGGELLVSREFRKSLRTVMATDCGGDNGAACWEDKDLGDLSQPGWVALQSVALRSRRSINPVAAAKHGSRRQRLCFAAYTQHCSNANEAFYVMKTLQKPIHNQLIRHRGEYQSTQALRDDVDHIAAGYHLSGLYSDLNGHQTRIIMTAYVATPPAPPSSNTPQPRSRVWGIGQPRKPSLSSRRSFIAAIANAESKYVVNLLAAATLCFDQLVRRRRLGYQAIQHMPATRNVLQERKCNICHRHFGLLRLERFCQLCAHVVCRDCSRKFDVEPVARRVRRNRVCFDCIANVDAQVFQQENPLLGVRSSEVFAGEDDRLDDDAASDVGSKISTAFYDILLSKDEADTTSKSTRKREPRVHGDDHRSSATRASVSLPSTPGRQLADALFSGDPLVRARALEIVRQVVKHVTSDSAPTSTTSSASSPASSPYSASVPVLHSQHPNRKMVDKYLEARLHLSSISLSGDLSPDSKSAGRGRSSSLYSLHEVTQRRQRSATDHNFATTSAASRYSHAARQWTTSPSIATELDLDDDPDSAALDAICEVAVMRMGCTIAYIVALNGAHSTQAQRIVGSCGAPRCWAGAIVCPFNLLAGGKAFVVRDPMSDLHLRRLRIERDVGVRFFAGFPIKSPNGAVVACLCTVDAAPRERVSTEDLAAMHALAKLAADLFEEEVNPYTPRSRA